MTEQTYSYGDYLANLPDDRKDAVERVWQVVRENIAKDYTERISPKFLTFAAEDEMCIALANQKNYISLYLMPIYVFPELKAKLDESGKKLKGGKSCVNFRRADELPLDVIAEIVRAYDAKAYKEQMRQVRAGEQSKKSA
jgi:uncharacterized protein YdhG (YjbR/CyaY superfamily)